MTAPSELVGGPLPTPSHAYSCSADLARDDTRQLLDGTELKKFHLAFSPAVKEALRIEAQLSGITQTEIIREAVLAWIGDRIDQRTRTIERGGSSG